MNYSDEEKTMLVDLLEYRAAEYSMLSNIFVRESSPEAIRQIIEASKEIASQKNSEGEDCASQDALDRVQLDLAQAMVLLDQEPFDDMATKTRTEYMRLFIGLRRIVVPAHESLYHGNSHRMMTEVTMDVRRAYLAAGFEVVKKNTEPDDHMGTELEFMANLCKRCAESVSQGEDPEKDLRAQEQFLANHLNRWLPAFADATVENDQSGYYGPWAEYLRAFVAQDAESLKECLSFIER